MLRLFIGRYTAGDPSARPAPGITVATFDPDRLTITPVGGVASPESSFLALADGVLYAARERDEGEVAAFAADDLTALGVRPTGGALPCYVAVDPAGRDVLVANYGSGSVSVHPIRDDGVGHASDTAQHTGSGPRRDRQEGPHAHMVTAAPDGGTILAVDLGTDSVYAYLLEAGSGRLKLLAQNRMRAGSGPRHLAFHPCGEYLYLANELANTVAVCRYDPATGAVTEIATHDAAPAPAGGDNLPAGIVISPDARFVYLSNRGDDSIAGFRIESGGAVLRPVGRWSCGGVWPRHITLSPDGRFLFSANQRSHDVAVLRVDPDRGDLSAPVASLPVHQVAHVLVG